MPYRSCIRLIVVIMCRCKVLEDKYDDSVFTDFITMFRRTMVFYLRHDNSDHPLHTHTNEMSLDTGVRVSSSILASILGLLR